MAYAQIVIDINHSAVDRFFTYRIPDALPVKPGHHVFVPFGQGDRLKEGFVVALSDSTDLDHSAVKDIDRIIEPYPVLTEDQLVCSSTLSAA